MRRSVDNKTQNRRGIGGLAKRSIDKGDSTNATTSFDFTVLYYKRKNKVHKSKGVSKFDGTLAFVRSGERSTTPSSITLRSEDGVVVHRGGMRGESGEFTPGQVISVGAFDVEILSLDKTSGTPSTAVTGKSKSFACGSSAPAPSTQRSGKSLGIGKSSKRVGLGGMRPLVGRTRKPALQLTVNKKQKTSWVDSENSENVKVEVSSSSMLPKTAAVLRRKTLPGFKRPILGKSTSGLAGSSRQRNMKLLPKGNAAATPRNSDTQFFFPGAIGSPMVPHSIRKVLRPHQVEGVVFLWNCLTGNGQVANLSPHFGDEETEFEDCDREETRMASKASPKGCILSDEMGLGKTLMTIATISALHRKNRTNRFVVVCPASLVNNWAREFDKWLGNVGLPKRVVIKKGGEEGIRQLKAFCTIKPSNISEVLIVSYELFRMKAAIFKNVQRVALLVVDEGHRLKNTSGSLTMTALESLPCEARLCITATPIQNNLGDMYTIVNFVCPGVFGDIATFRREYERPITAISNKRNKCTCDQIRKGEESCRILDRILQSVMLRRLQKDILKKLLPPRHEFLLFCRPTTRQRNLYKTIAKCHDKAGESSQEVLTALMKLRKICAHPNLLESPQPGKFDCEGSGKLVVLRDLILQMREKEPTDKVVIVSNFTSTLTVIEETILKQSKLNFLRLDGSINSADRQSLVDTFNRTSASMNFALTLSSKAGGVGLNLIGANRLIMVDPDW